MKLRLFLIFPLLGGFTSAAEEEPAFPVAIHVDVSRQLEELNPIWRFFGADEPNYAYMKDGEKLLGELGAFSPGNVYFRAHNMLTTGDGTPALKWGSTNAYTEAPDGSPIYDWTVTDRIFDAYLRHGVRPYVQLGFMPQALSTHPEPYQHHWTPKAKYEEIYLGWSYPPKDYAKWEELCYQWAKHCAEKYGADEVSHWWWELWNEPNIGYWHGTPEEYLKLYDYSTAGVRRALPKARIGGPETAGGPGGAFLENFLTHCLSGANAATGATGAPLDLISFHAKGSPQFIDGHVRMGIANQLRNIDSAFAVIARHPELKQTPIVIGESDPDGCAACQGPQLGYRNTTMYAGYTAATFARKHELAAKHGVNLEGALTWAFEFENQPYFAGFRVMASNGLDLPVLNVFRMMSRMRGHRLAAESDGQLRLAEVMTSGVRARPDVGVLASADQTRVSLLVWHYHDDDVPGPPAEITVALDHLPFAGRHLRLRQFRIDAQHSNAYEAWKKMGSPEAPTPVQYTELERAGQLTELPAEPQADGSRDQFKVVVKLPRQAVSLLELESAD